MNLTACCDVFSRDLWLDSIPMPIGRGNRRRGDDCLVLSFRDDFYSYFSRMNQISMIHFAAESPGGIRGEFRRSCFFGGINGSDPTL